MSKMGNYIVELEEKGVIEYVEHEYRIRKRTTEGGLPTEAGIFAEQHRGDVQIHDDRSIIFPRD